MKNFSYFKTTILLLLIFGTGQCQNKDVKPSSNAPVMKSIPGGTFIMGCNPNVDPDCFSDEQPTRSVTLSAYQLSETEVTQTQWQTLMGSNPSYFSNCPQCPVEHVSWYDAVVYCNRLSESVGLEPCYYSNPGFTSVYGKSGSDWTLPNGGTVYWKTSAKGYRLPTEAEWEFAARDGVSNQIYAGGNVIDSVAWYSSNSGGQTQPVKQKPANGAPNYQLYDMSGNVWEWCFDWYDSYPPGSLTNPTGPVSGSNRVFRSGSWNNDAAYCRVANRNGDTPDYRKSNDYRKSYVGFRLARTL
jgi:formylglycine-generating enzyme required for sulfatase activity